MKVKQIMTAEITSVGPETNLADVAGMMSEKDIGWVPVLKDGKVLGVITDRDIVLRSVAAGKNPKAVSAREVASPSTLSVRDNEDIEEASRLMAEKQVRRLLVVDNNDHAVGVISLSDLASRMRGNELAGATLGRITRTDGRTARRV
jgi:CBS domain-containing protein